MANRRPARRRASERHPIRNSVFAGVIVLAIGSFGATVTGYLPTILQSLKEAGVSIVGLLAQPVSVPLWLFALICIAIVPTLIRIVSQLRRSRPWSKYTQDAFHDMLWRWSYDKQGNVCRLVAFCREDDTILVWFKNRDFRSVSARCETCGNVFPLGAGNQQYARESVERQIDRKIRVGEWKQVVAAQMKDSSSKQAAQA